METAFAVYPNPIDDAFTIGIQAEQNFAVSVTMTDLPESCFSKSVWLCQWRFNESGTESKPASGFYNMLTTNYFTNQFTTKVLVQ